jgi:hypothetical protein
MKSPDPTANVVYQDIARMRFPDCTIQGAGNLAVVLHCCKRVVLVAFALEGRLIKSQKCGAACHLDDDPRWHRGYCLDEPRPDTPYRSTKRFPGWDDED